jgi:hypothetical protein
MALPLGSGTLRRRDARAGLEGDENGIEDVEDLAAAEGV